MDDTPRIADLRKKLDKDPGSRLFAQLAEELRKEGRFEDAIAVAQTGLQKNPNYPSARLTLARAQLDANRPAEARLGTRADRQGVAGQHSGQPTARAKPFRAWATMTGRSDSSNRPSASLRTTRAWPGGSTSSRLRGARPVAPTLPSFSSPLPGPPPLQPPATMRLPVRRLSIETWLQARSAQGRSPPRTSRGRTSEVPR